MIAAGTSVISSHAARKRSGSRAQSTSARISRKAAVSAPVARPPASGTRYLVANKSDGAPTTPEDEQEEAARRIDAELWLEGARERRAELLA